MRIGLLRHFPVDQEFPKGWNTAVDLQKWRERYDAASVSTRSFDLGGVDWPSCISSDLPRASITARAVFRGEIKYTELLREAQFATFSTGSIRLPFWAWRWMLRFAWTTGHRSQRDCRQEFERRVVIVANQLCITKEDTLVVSHAGMMAYLSAELRRRGFAGPKFRIADHARVYIYEKRQRAGI